jgi:hypothetical protein
MFTIAADRRLVTRRFVTGHPGSDTPVAAL